jgi:hypothetical protein
MEPIQYNSGDLVIHNGQLCIVRNVEKTRLGFNSYLLNNVESGDEFWAPKHSLEMFSVGDEAPILEVDWDIPVKVDPGDVDVQIVNADQPLTNVDVTDKSTRYVELTEDDMDEVARQRLSHNTEYQTRWYVNLLKGTLMKCNKKSNHYLFGLCK